MTPKQIAELVIAVQHVTRLQIIDELRAEAGAGSNEGRAASLNHAADYLQGRLPR